MNDYIEYEQLGDELQKCKNRVLIDDVLNKWLSTDWSVVTCTDHLSI